MHKVKKPMQKSNKQEKPLKPLWKNSMEEQKYIFIILQVQKCQYRWDHLLGIFFSGAIVLAAEPSSRGGGAAVGTSSYHPLQPALGSLLSLHFAFLS